MVRALSESLQGFAQGLPGIPWGQHHQAGGDQSCCGHGEECHGETGKGFYAKDDLATKRAADMSEPIAERNARCANFCGEALAGDGVEKRDDQSDGKGRDESQNGNGAGGRRKADRRQDASPHQCGNR